MFGRGILCLQGFVIVFVCGEGWMMELGCLRAGDLWCGYAFAVCWRVLGVGQGWGSSCVFAYEVGTDVGCRGSGLHSVLFPSKVNV